ncbi:Programmed cell death protein 2 [Babesia duncani]|uniref:Programmed cell death protein 2 n=1 Tax=Babesia duncani TaxID=323732 RepID=A0AAD9PIC4_9APIC|nr:Programmed cell death protein 2 [Babesia duncani]
MNTVSDWLGGLDLSPQTSSVMESGDYYILMHKAGTRKQRGNILDNHINDLLKRYKTRNRDEIDPEDLKDLNVILSNIDNEGSDSNSDFDEDEPPQDPQLLKLQQYLLDNFNAIIRYHHGNVPLLGTGLHEDTCTNCKAKLEFEFELLPQILNYMVGDDASIGLHVHIVTVSCFTCKCIY